MLLLYGFALILFVVSECKAGNTAYLLYGNNQKDPSYYQVGQESQLLKDPKLILSNPTIVYFHGFRENLKHESVITIVQAYEIERDYNILLVDWSSVSMNRQYTMAVMQLKYLGEEVAQVLSVLLEGGLSLRRLHLVGYLMGAHLAAYTARDLKNYGFLVPRLTGLDPARPSFYPAIIADHISPNDAEFVDIIHTDGGIVGVESSTGHADFFPNGGIATQPGCPKWFFPFSEDSYCGSRRAWRFWAESVISDKFIARQCESYDKFNQKKCGNAVLAPMGEKADTRLRGNFYLRTAASRPYALGDDGIYPE